MFDISWTEFLLVGIVALIVIGPKELPGVLRTLGQYTRKVRGMAAEFQNQFQEAMREAMVGKTVIAIAHRLSTVMDMDRLIVLQRGVIVADGSHSELLQQGGLYAELWYRQSGEFNPAARHPPEPVGPVDFVRLNSLADSEPS